MIDISWVTRKLCKLLIDLTMPSLGPKALNPKPVISDYPILRP